MKKKLEYIVNSLKSDLIKDALGVEYFDYENNELDIMVEDELIPIRDLSDANDWINRINKIKALHNIE